MIEGSFSVRIDRSPAQVFGILTDFETYLARWAKGPVAAKRLAPATEAGTKFTVTARVGPFQVSSPYEVKTYEPPHLFGGTGIAGPVVFDEEYVLKPSETGTELTQTMTAVEYWSRPAADVARSEPWAHLGRRHPRRVEPASDLPE